MSNALNWKVYNLIRTVPEGVVTTVCCQVFMVDGDDRVGGNINQDVPYKNPSDPDFVPFDSLTEAQVIQWVQNQLGPEKIAKMERSLQASLNQRKTQKAEGVPW
jgi:hypothetical protein